MTLAFTLAVRPRLVAATLLFSVGPFLRAAPTITQQPADVAVTSGQNATFTVAATGSGVLTYQWRRSGFAIPGATNATFVWGGATLGESGYYDVVVSDGTGTTHSSVAQLTVAPRAYPAIVAPDPGYAVPLEANAGLRIDTFAPSSDGGYYVGGSFASVDGVRRTLVMHVTNAGTLDSMFNAPEITGNDVTSIAVQPDGKVLIGGNFTDIGGNSHPGVARLNTDGSLDGAFSPLARSSGDVIAIAARPDGKFVLSGYSVPRFALYNPDGSLNKSLGDAGSTVTAIASQPDGKFIAIGRFGADPYGAAYVGAIRFNSDSSVDPTFQMAAYDGSLQAIAIAPDGRVYISAAPAAGKGAPTVLRLSATGAVDGTFAPTFDTPVRALGIDGYGRVVVAGNFSIVNGAVHPALVRLNPSGALDVTFATSFPWGGYFRALLVRPDNTVVVGADFFPTRVDAYGPVRYLADGSRASTPNFSMRAPGYTTAMVTLPGGKMAVVGVFDHAGAVNTTNLLRLNGDSSLDTTFATSTGEPLPDGISAALALPDGRMVVGGDFHNFMGLTASGVAILKPNGAPDYSFVPDTTIPVRGNALALTPDGKLVVAGFLSNGSTAANAIVAYNVDGSRAAGFASGIPFDNAVTRLIAQRDGRLLVTGNFTIFNGTAVKPLIRLNADGTLDAAFGANIHLTMLYCVQLATSGQIYVSGVWSGPDGTAGGIIRLNADGTRDPSYQTSTDGSVTGFVLQADGKAIVRIATIGSVYLARLNADGSADRTFRAIGLDVEDRGDGLHMLLRDDGQLAYAEGVQQADRLCATTTAGAPVITAAPAPTVVPVGGSVTLRVAATSVIPLTYQWQYNGAPIADATTATYTVANLSAANVGDYSVAVSNQLGSVTTGPVAVTAPLDPAAHVVNLSVRANAADSNPLVLGVVLGGSGTGGDKPLLFRAAGPTLAYFGVPGALPDPVLELYDGTGFKIDQNDDWAGVFDFTSLGAFPFRGTAPKDAAIYDPYATNGAQTIHIVGKPGTSGVVLGEVYDATAGGTFTVTTPRIINGSARTTAGLGDNALILGFGVAGQGSVRVLIRAVGPTLAAAPFNLGGMLADPTLEIHAADNTILATNDNWSDGGAGATMTTAFDSVGAFHLGAGSKDSAAIITLTPGTYSAVVRGAGATSGTAMVELYVLP